MMRNVQEFLWSSRSTTTTFVQKHILKLQNSPSFKHLSEAFNSIRNIGENLSFDKDPRGFKGKYSIKFVIKFKKEDNSYLLDCIGDEVFIYTFPSKQL